MTERNTLFGHAKGEHDVYLSVASNASSLEIDLGVVLWMSEIRQALTSVSSEIFHIVLHSH